MIGAVVRRLFTSS